MNQQILFSIYIVIQKLLSARRYMSGVDVLAFHGLFNSNPGGATALSVCPLREPVSRMSRSITSKL